MIRPALRRIALLALLPLGALLAACASNSKPWACSGQECGSPCWPGPRLGCPEPCLLEPCPLEPWCPEPKKPKCKPRPVCVPVCVPVPAPVQAPVPAPVAPPVGTPAEVAPAAPIPEGQK